MLQQIPATTPNPDVYECKVCGDPTTRPDALCCQECHETFYNEDPDDDEDDDGVYWNPDSEV